MIAEEITEGLFARQDEAYRAFQAPLIPTVEPSSVIGVRFPGMRAYARELKNDPRIGDFLSDLPHRYYDEYQLHAVILSGMKDYDECIAAVNTLLPFVNNWAVCDTLKPKVFAKHKAELLSEIEKWLASGSTFTVRFGIGMLMSHFLDADFDRRYPAMVASVRSEEYYVNMMQGWYFATALAKQYEAVLPFIESNALDPVSHNMAIRKACESFRITPEQKEYLKTLRRKAPRETAKG